MLNNDPYFFDTISTITAAFGTMFNDLYIRRDQANNAPDQLIRVPLAYAGKDRKYARVDDDPEIQRPAVVLPRMSFMFKGMQYDGSRKFQSTGRTVRMSTNANKLRRQYNPVPYNLFYQLSILSDSMKDSVRIVEQILPFFTPEFTMSLRLIPDFEENVDVPFILNNPEFADNFEGDFNAQRRTVEWDLNFTAKAYLWGPIKDKPIVKYAYQKFYLGANTEELVGQTLTIPGQTANGEPTSNADNSVAANTILANSTFGFIETANGNIFE